MHGRRRAWLVAVEQHGTKESAPFGIAGSELRRGRIARDDAGIRPKLGDPFTDFLTLAKAGQRTHPRAFLAGVAHSRLAESRRQRVDQVVAIRAWCEHPANRRALLSRLYGDFAHHFANEEVEFLAVRPGIRSQDGGVEAVGLHGETHRIVDDGGVSLQHAPRGRGARKGHHVLTGDTIEQIAHRARDELERTFRQQAGLDDPPDHQLRQIGGLAGRLHDSRHSREQRGRQFLQDSPAREIEGVDMDGDPFERREDMLAGKGLIARQLVRFPVEQEVRIGQLAPAFGCIGEKGTDAAFDVDPAIGPGRTGCGRQGVELLLARHQGLADGLEHQRAVVEAQPAQRRAAHFPAMGEHGGEVNPAGVDPRDRVAGRGIEYRLAGMGAAHPFAADAALQRTGLGDPRIHGETSLLGSGSSIERRGRDTALFEIPLDRHGVVGKGGSFSHGTYPFGGPAITGRR